MTTSDRGAELYPRLPSLLAEIPGFRNCLGGLPFAASSAHAARFHVSNVTRVGQVDWQRRRSGQPHDFPLVQKEQGGHNLQISCNTCRDCRFSLLPEALCLIWEHSVPNQSYRDRIDILRIRESCADREQQKIPRWEKGVIDINSRVGQATRNLTKGRQLESHWVLQSYCRAESLTRLPFLCFTALPVVNVHWQNINSLEFHKPHHH